MTKDEAIKEAARVKERLRGADTLDALTVVCDEERALVREIAKADGALGIQIVNLREQKRTTLKAAIVNWGAG